MSTDPTEVIVQATTRFCEICCYGPRHRGMNMIRCTTCNIDVHIECYLAVTLDQGKYVDKDGGFTCLACQSIGREVEAVQTHWSTDYKKITQKERPTKCELCSVSDVVTAMHPLYDYHGKAGRQLYVKDDDGEIRAAWGHSICCLYLTTMGFLYGVFAGGDYESMEEDDEDGEVDATDPREPNPTSTMSPDFKKMAMTSEAICYYRYYAVDPNAKTKKLDMYRAALKEHKNGITCTFCQSDDKDPYSLRVPQQCVAGMSTEFDWIGSGRIQKSGKLHPHDKNCFVAMHVGCARYGLPNPDGIQRVHWWHLNTDEVCLYCTKHANDVGIKLPSVQIHRMKSKPAESKGVIESNQKRKAMEATKENSLSTKKKKSTQSTESSVSKHKSKLTESENVPVSSQNEEIVATKKAQLDSQLTPQPDASSEPLQGKISSQPIDFSAVLPSGSIPTKKKKKTMPVPDANRGPQTSRGDGVATTTNRRGFQWGQRKTKDRYAELDSSLAVAVNAGDRPTLKKSRRELADQKSIVTNEKVQMILNDLLKTIKRSSDKEQWAAAIKGRKLFWKREFSELTQTDFKDVWAQAKEKYTAVQTSMDKDSESQQAAGTSNPKGNRELHGNDDTGASTKLVEDNTSIPNAAARSEASREEEEPFKPYQDQWSHLFVGPSFRMGNVFNMDKFDEVLM